MHPAEAVAILDGAPAAKALRLNQDPALAVTLAGDDLGSGVRFGAHVEPVIAADVDDAMLLSGDHRIGLRNTHEDGNQDGAESRGSYEAAERGAGHARSPQKDPVALTGGA